MAFDWAEFSAFADVVGQTPVAGCDAEASKRSAISRAYYGLAIRARNALALRLGVPPKGAPMHAALFAQLQAYGDADVRQLGFVLDSMRRRRNKADYDDAFSGLDAELSTQLTIARQAEPHLTKI